MKNINLLRKIAWSFHQSTGLDWDDLFQEAYIAYDKALRTYDPTRGKITTHVWYCVHSHLKNYLKEEKQYKEPLCDIENAINETITPHPYWERVNLTQRCQKALKIILQKANDIDTYLPANILQYVCSLLINAGYEEKEANEIIKQLQKAF